MSDLVPTKNRKTAATLLGRMFVDLAPPEGGRFTDAMMESYVEKACRLPEDLVRQTVQHFCDGQHGSAFAPRPAEFMAKATALWEEARRRQPAKPPERQDFEVRDGVRYRDRSPYMADLDRERRIEIVRRVNAKYPVGGKMIAGLISGEAETEKGSR